MGTKDIDAYFEADLRMAAVQIEQAREAREAKRTATTIATAPQGRKLLGRELLISYNTFSSLETVPGWRSWQTRWT